MESLKALQIIQWEKAMILLGTLGDHLPTICISTSIYIAGRVTIKSHIHMLIKTTAFRRCHFQPA